MRPPKCIADNCEGCQVKTGLEGQEEKEHYGRGT